MKDMVLKQNKAVDNGFHCPLVKLWESKRPKSAWVKFSQTVVKGVAAGGILMIILSLFEAIWRSDISTSRPISSRKLIV